VGADLLVFAFGATLDAFFLRTVGISMASDETSTLAKSK